MRRATVFPHEPCVQVDAHPVAAELDSYPLAYVQIDGLDEGFVFGDGGLAL